MSGDGSPRRLASLGAIAQGAILPGAVGAFVFDVDGVLVDSPHEHAWREALRELEGDEAAEAFTADAYRRLVSGRPRADGARAALAHAGASAQLARAYAERKQALMGDLIDAGAFRAYDDAVGLVRSLQAAGVPVAAASSSKNAHRFLRALELEPDADVSGLDVPGKPDPAIFLAAAAALGVSPYECFVVEDAVAGVRAAKAAGMTAIGVARAGDESALRAAGADVVVRDLGALYSQP
jgi:HAD superfamily hydrolase (TIGR01509 family)